MMVHDKPRDWKALAAAVAGGQDPEKLMSLVAELDAALADHQRQIRGEKISKRVLFVDHEENIRLTLPPILCERGFDV
jgi:hypothetical protein